MKNQVLFSFVFLAIFSGATLAHHSFVEFDVKRSISVSGVVKEFRLVNPHAMMTLEATGEDGVITEWKVEFDGRVNLGRAGWTPETIKPGESITVVGNPAVSGSPYMFFNTAVKSDGTQLIRPLLKSFNAIDEERRLRRQNRENQD